MHARTAMAAVAGILIPGVRCAASRALACALARLLAAHAPAERAACVQQNAARAAMVLAPLAHTAPSRGGPVWRRAATTPPPSHWHGGAPVCVHAPAAPRGAAPTNPAVACAQALTKAGALNVPEWYEAGKVYINSPGAVPFGARCAQCGRMGVGVRARVARGRGAHGAAGSPRARARALRAPRFCARWCCQACCFGMQRRGRAAALLARLCWRSCGAAACARAGTLLISTFFMYGFVEGKRWQDIRKPGSQVRVRAPRGGL